MTRCSTALRLAASIVAVGAIAIACSAETDAEGAADRSTADSAPTTIAGSADPAGTTAAPGPTGTAVAPTVPDGAEVYRQYCAECHGVDLRGTDKGPSQLSITYEPNHHGDYAYRVAIRDGTRQHHWWFGDMPPVEGISDLEIEKVIAFIRSEQERLGFER